MARKTEGKRSASAEETDLFERAMRGTRKVEGKRPAATPRAQAAPARLKSAPAAKFPPTPPAEPKPEVRPYTVERRRSVPGLDRRSTERLAKGQMRIEATLDLHGHRQEAAHRALEAFVLASHRAGRRCLLVVTGKGGARPEAGAAIMADDIPGVLKHNLPRWLATPPIADKVLALRQARPQHGGEGAFYVLLRRRRG